LQALKRTAATSRESFIAVLSVSSGRRPRWPKIATKRLAFNICARAGNGQFCLKRITISKRMRVKLKAASPPHTGRRRGSHPASAAAPLRACRALPPRHGLSRTRVLAGRAAVAARIAPVDGTAAESMRQATRPIEQHVARQLAKVRASSRLGAARRLIAAEALAAVAALIAANRGGGRLSSDYEVARLTVTLRDLRIWADAALGADLRAAILRNADFWREPRSGEPRRRGRRSQLAPPAPLSIRRR
jgi:hypothetical protein